MTYTPYQFANTTVGNGGQSTVAGGSGGLGTALNPADTTLHLPTGHGARFPATGYFIIQLGTNEYAVVTLNSADTLTLVRAQEGTSAGTWPVGTTVQAIVSAQALNDNMNELAALDSGKAALAGAAFTGAISTTSTLNVTGAITSAASAILTNSTPLSATAANAIIELGSLSSGNTPGIDFHSSGNNIDYDVRMLASGGTTISGEGALNFTAKAGVGFSHTISLGQSASAPSVASSGTITTANTGVSRVTTAGAVTAVVLQAGTVAGQVCIVVNESGNSITFAAAGTSNVADGVSAVIAANRAMWFVWDSGTSRWYHA